MNIGKDETADTFCGGKLTILQKVKGYRFSVDSLLLAGFVNLRKTDRVLDLGSGSGVLSILLAVRFRPGEIVGMEIQEHLAEMARRTAAMNHLEDIVKIIPGDAANIGDFFPPQSFDVVVSNPPYRKTRTGRTNENREKTVARHEIQGSLFLFLRSAFHALRDGGEVYLVYPAARAVELFHRMRETSLEPKTIRLVHSRRDSRGDLVLARGIKKGGEELKILPPLYLYGDDGRYTPEAEDIFRILNDCSVPSLK